MKENNITKHLEIAIENIEAAKEILKHKAEEEPKDKKVTLTFKIKNPYDGVEVPLEEWDKIREDLEEIINDFTRE